MPKSKFWLRTAPVAAGMDSKIPNLVKAAMLRHLMTRSDPIQLETLRPESIQCRMLFLEKRFRPNYESESKTERLARERLADYVYVVCLSCYERSGLGGSAVATFSDHVNFYHTLLAR